MSWGLEKRRAPGVGRADLVDRTGVMSQSTECLSGPSWGPGSSLTASHSSCEPVQPCHFYPMPGTAPRRWDKYK